MAIFGQLSEQFGLILFLTSGHSGENERYYCVWKSKSSMQSASVWKRERELVLVVLALHIGCAKQRMYEQTCARKEGSQK